MSSISTAWRVIKGILAGSAVAFGTVGVILLIEIYDGIPDTLSWVVLVIGVLSVGYSGWRASRPPRKDIGSMQSEVSFE